MANERTYFAPNVLLIDARQLNDTVKGMKNFFEHQLQRTLPKADLSVLLECVALDAHIESQQNQLQAVLIYDDSIIVMDEVTPSHLENDLNKKAFASPVGEFEIIASYASELITRKELFREAYHLLIDEKSVQRILLLPEETSLSEIVDDLKNMEVKKEVTLFGMKPLKEPVPFTFEILGYAIMKALGIQADEL